MEDCVYPAPLSPSASPYYLRVRETLDTSLTRQHDPLYQSLLETILTHLDFLRVLACFLFSTLQAKR